MKKERLLGDDGRYIIFYEFEEEREEGGRGEGDGRQPYTGER